MADYETREELLERLREENARIMIENDVYEAYLQRVVKEPKEGEAEPAPEMKKGKSAKGRSAKDKGQQVKVRNLTNEEKYDVVTSEIEVLTKDVEEVKRQKEKELSDLRALLEETDLRIAETKKDTYEFKRDIVIGAENFRTGKTAAEKMMRYLEGCSGAKDSMIEKLKLKNSTLKVQIQKLEQQLQQKEEMGEVLHVIDFDQLKIENQQYLEKIEERNNELLRLKLTTGKTVQVLNRLKKKLGDLTAYGEFLRQDTADRRDQLSKFEEDIARVESERAAAVKQNNFLHADAEDTTRPQVMEYIMLKSNVSELEKKKTDWERKIEIAQMETTRVNQTSMKLSKKM